MDAARGRPLRWMAWIVGTALGVLLVVTPLGMLARRPPPFTTQHVRPLLETLRADLRPGDRVYVPHGE